MDFAQARLNMVEGQLRPNGVVDPRVVEAMLALPREACLPPVKRAMAYVDADVPLSPGRWLIEPMALARLVQAAEPAATDRALVIAAGAGYAAALLSRLVASVIAQESPERLADLRAGLAALGADEVPAVAGPLTEGWPAEAPYDVILIDGGVEVVPETILNQLAEGGRLVTVETTGQPGVLGRAVRWVRVAGVATRLELFDAGTPLLPEFRRKRGFVF